MGRVTTFRIDVPTADIDDLRERLERTRWPDDVAAGAADWDAGTPPAVLRPLVARWLDGYDWAATQERWNALAQHRVVVDDMPIHVVRAGTPGATPLVLVHGWPDGFLRFERALPAISDRFDVIIPTIPGFGFSGHPDRPGWGPTRVADAFIGVLDALGIARAGVHGADLGSTVAESMAARHPDRILALHLGDVPAWHRYTIDPATVSADEAAFLNAMSRWFADEGAYAALQRTKPLSLAYGLDDSPTGLAGWIVEKLRAWSDCDGDLHSRFTADEVLDDVSLYWFTRTGGSAARYYRESAIQPVATTRARVPTGFLIFPRDIACPPQAYAERFFDVRRFTRAPRGGHFGPWEEPDIWAEDLRAFFDTLE